MARFLFSLLAACVLAGPVSAKKITVRWYGQSFFEIKSDDGTVIAIDPHFLQAYERREIKADLVLISHEHNDHNSLEDITLNKDGKLLRGLKKAGKTFDWAEFDEKHKGIRVQSVGTYHDEVQGMEKGKNSIFVIDVDGMRVVHLGDLGHKLTASQLKKLGTVDVLMIPVGGVYALNGSKAKEVVAQIKPRYHVIPMHYGTKVYDYLLTEEEFLDEVDAKKIDRLKTNELVINTDAVPTREPRITVLGYEDKKKDDKDKKDK